jgi:hypothetical protein
MVPSLEPTLLGTSHHLLLNELRRSPDTLLRSVIALAEQAAALDTGSPRSSTATIILYCTRLCARVDSYVTLLLACDSDQTHLDASTAHDLDIPEHTRGRLEAARVQLRALLWGALSGVLFSWYTSLARECEEDTADDALLAANTKLLAKIQAHVVLAMRNIRSADLDASRVTHICTALTFLTTRHEYSGPDPACLALPEIEVFGALQHCRRTVLTWLRERATKAELHAVMDATIAGASTGARGTSHTSPTWSFVFG